MNLNGLRGDSKRAFDVAISFSALVVAAPVTAVAAVAIWLNDGRPILYRSRRVGERGRVFDLWKLRTMVRDADRAPLGTVTIRDDDRVTPTGRVLRRWKIDELPQLVNVLLGDMSLVGPRPETPAYVATYSAEQRNVLRYRPGLTSPASIAFVDEAELLEASDDPREKYLAEIMPEEIRIDLAYMAGATVASDVRVLLSTLATILGRAGAHR